jgi:serine/threonine-protein kinase
MIGKKISHFKILEKLGQGGMGIVYKAQDVKLDRFVALKFLPPHLTTSEEEKQRFIHEAKSASALQHNNICAIHEIDETEDGQLFICMDYYEGETLKKKIEPGQLLSIDEILDIAIQIATGLARAHESNITHRDLKPANIMITNRSEVKIVDFGLAKLAGQTKLTKEGTTLGTIAYMSPERTSQR